MSNQNRVQRLETGGNVAGLVHNMKDSLSAENIMADMMKWCKLTWNVVEDRKRNDVRINYPCTSVMDDVT